MPRIETSLSLFVNDLDMASYYPSTMRSCNIARDTLKTAVFKIEGRERSEVENYFTGIINPRENSVPLCSKFHSYPTYAEMNDFVRDNKTISEV